MQEQYNNKRQNNGVESLEIKRNIIQLKMINQLICSKKSQTFWMNGFEYYLTKNNEQVEVDDDHIENKKLVNKIFEQINSDKDKND